MDDKTIIDITNLDAEKHAENAAKRVASYSEKLLHHASILSEKEYQKFLLERLEKDNGYVVRKASDFDRYFAVDREMLFKFLEDTQHETMEYLRKIYKNLLSAESYMIGISIPSRHLMLLSGHRSFMMSTSQRMTDSIIFILL